MVTRILLDHVQSEINFVLLDFCDECHSGEAKDFRCHGAISTGVFKGTLDVLFFYLEHRFALGIGKGVFPF